jgi:WS/DGAT/MGAT family acyltransferase
VTRLSTIDSSFLRIETPSAHMHVGWLSIVEPPAGSDRVELAELTQRVAGRLHLLPRFRQRVTPVPFGLAEPVWCDFPAFDVHDHVRELPPAVVKLGVQRCVDAFFSEPLRRDRPLWEIALIPGLADGNCALVGKIHHAMVDGVAAVELGLLLFDSAADAEIPSPAPWRPAPAQSPASIAFDAVADRTSDAVRTAGRAAGLIRRPGSAAAGGQTVARAALSIARDVLQPAPASHLNVEIGPARVLVTHSIALARLVALKDRCGVKLNDVVLATCAGALRRYALSCGERPRNLRVMVPVNTRQPGEHTAGAGNRITFGFVELPVGCDRTAERLRRVSASMEALKRDGRIPGSSALLAGASALPEPAKDRAARIASSPRLYNLIISNVPGPRTPLYVGRARVRSIHPVIPIPDRHALSIGVLTYDHCAHFSCYADPRALPGVEKLADAIEDALIEFETAMRGVDDRQQIRVRARARPRSRRPAQFASLRGSGDPLQ